MGGTGGDGMMWEDKGMGDGSDVVTIGDSWMRLNPTLGIEQSLAKASGRTYRNYGVPGTMVLDGAIPGQLDAAIAENPNIKTLIMTGGGNDILLGNIFCTVQWADSCNDTVYEVADALTALREKMADAGIEDVVILSYDYIPNMVVRPGLDLSVMLSNEMCTPDAMPRCHFLNNLNTVSDKIGGDGIHPTAEGYDILGQRVWDLLQERGLRR
jgi:lysophospholipase L1-like esterase